MRKVITKNIAKPSIRKYDKGTYQEYILFHGRFKDSNGENTNKKVKDKWLSNLVRAKKNIKDIIYNNLNNTSSMITLTFAENIQDYDIAQKQWKLLLQKIKRKYEKNLKYIAVMELQQRGAIHYHIITFNESIYNLENDKIADMWGNGFTYKKNIDDINVFTRDKLSNYLGKYLSSADNKDQLIDKNKKMYFTSRNLKKVESKKINTIYKDYIIKNGNARIEISNSITKVLIDTEKDKKLFIE